MSFYGPADGDSGGGGGGEKRPRQHTPRGQMSGGYHSKPAISDLTFPLRKLFDPPPPLEKIKALNPPKLCKRPMTGIGAMISLFEVTPPPAVEPHIPKSEIIAKMKLLKMEEHKKKNDLLAQTSYNPISDRNATGDPYLTLFIGRLSYDTTDKKLRREFEQFGMIKTVRVVTDNDGKSRGYAFVEFQNKDDMMEAYRRMDGKKIDSRKILVDVERCRTVQNWRPARLGGGLGGRKPKMSKKMLKEEKYKSEMEAELKKQQMIFGPAPTSGTHSLTHSFDSVTLTQSTAGGSSYNESQGPYGPPSHDRRRDDSRERRRSRSRDRNNRGGVGYGRGGDQARGNSRDRGGGGGRRGNSRDRGGGRRGDSRERSGRDNRGGDHRRGDSRGRR